MGGYRILKTEGANFDKKRSVGRVVVNNCKQRRKIDIKFPEF
jgi:hypothetical protein